MSESNANGRDPMTGRMLPGNRIAQGNRGSNPVTRRLHEIRRAILESTSEAEMRDVWDRLHAMALEGDIRAIELFLAYAWGRPTAALEVSGPEGGPADLASLTAVVLGALAGHPELRLKVAEALGGSGGLVASGS